MIISETPVRVSFFGGGTDYPEYFVDHGGAVLGTTIDKFAYLSVTQFYSRLFDYKIRLAYRKVESVNSLEEIQHAPFRECLRQCGISENIEVAYTAELPSFSGLGSSSTFVVGVLNALHSFLGHHLSPMDLAYQSIHLERDVLHEAVGCQDQVFAAAGGFNLIEFRKLDDIVVHKVSLSSARRQELESHLMLLYTGIQRRAQEVAARQIGKIPQNRDRLAKMRLMVDRAHAILTGSGSLTGFGDLLHESWCLKAELDETVASEPIREIYRLGREAGALGGKLLGAGGGGFMLFFVPPDRRQAVHNLLPGLEEIPISLDSPGSRIIHG